MGLSFKKLSALGHEQVVFFNDPTCGLKAIVAIHDTTLGPALGGTRMWPYSNEEDALEDVLRLSRGMTYKAAVSGLNLGGGKAVIIGNPETDKSEALFRSFGRFIESLNGRYITAEDVNISVEDIEHIYVETNNVTGVAKVHGGSGNPAPYTALGVLRGIEASLQKIYGSKNVKGRKIAIQGAGAVGTHLAEELAKLGAHIYFCDISPKNIERLLSLVKDAQVVSPEEIYDLPVDIFSPCALGATINDNTIPRLKCKIVAGCANNQLHEDRHGLELKNRGILYAPDYLINAGGLMNVSIEFEGWSEAKVMRMVDTIFDQTLKIFKISDDENIPVNRATDILAERRISSIKNLKRLHLGKTHLTQHRFPGRKKLS